MTSARRPVTPTPTSRKHPNSPQKRKVPYKTRNSTRSKPAAAVWTVNSIVAKLKERLNIQFTPDPWQPFILSKIMTGHDSIIVAGTGYGKSLIFEGLVALGGKGKVVVIICPLKALENDQVSSARSKGIDAVTINDDTPVNERKTLWSHIHQTAEAVYVSPEMALSDGFQSLWADSKFRERLTAVVIDEAHCVQEWGTTQFRPEYAMLSRLRTYTGQEVPFVACTATCPTQTFNTLWNNLGYGCRPFWGIDVGCDRPNLFFHTRVFENPSDPTLDLLNLLPETIDDTTQLEDLKKMLIYIDSEAACRHIRNQFRRVLPPHLRGAVRAFSSTVSDQGKKELWEDLKSGKVRIVIATDAAGMGCNVDDVELTVILGCPKSFSIVAQRWGRAGRARESQGSCLLLVPSWMFRPKEPLINPAVAALKASKSAVAKAEAKAKADAKKREGFPISLVDFVNLGDDQCAHRFLREHFRPDTQLTIRQGVEALQSTSSGHRAKQSPYHAIWTVLDLNRIPPKDRCCGLCNPNLAVQLQSSDIHDPRRFTYSNDFRFQTTLPPRPLSSASTCSKSTSSSFTPVKSRYTVKKEDKDSLTAKLKAWRKRRHAERGPGVMFSCQIALPDNLITSVVDNCRRFLQEKNDLTPNHVLSIIHWDSATRLDLDEVVAEISQWREEVDTQKSSAIPTTPTSQRRASKRPKTTPSSARPHLNKLILETPPPIHVPRPTSVLDVFGAPVQLPKPDARTPITRPSQSFLPTPVTTTRMETRIPPISARIPLASARATSRLPVPQSRLRSQPPSPPKNPPTPQTSSSSSLQNIWPNPTQPATPRPLYNSAYYRSHTDSSSCNMPTTNTPRRSYYRS